MALIGGHSFILYCQDRAEKKRGPQGEGAGGKGVASWKREKDEKEERSAGVALALSWFVPVRSKVKGQM